MKEPALVDPEKLGAFIRMLRESHGVSQLAMGNAIGLRGPQVSKLENGLFHLKIATVAAMLDALGYRLRIEISPK